MIRHALGIVLILVATLPSPAAETALPNPSFEAGLKNWDISQDGGMSTASPEAAYSGALGLRIRDTSEQKGSSVRSARFPVTDGKQLRLTFQARILSGGGVAVYVRFYAAGQSKRLGQESVSILTQNPQWKEYALQTVVPAGATEADLWIHSYDKATVEADFDRFELTTADLTLSPPWPGTYKLAATDTGHLTEADVPGPDGLVYPDWRMAGVPGGIPEVKPIVKADFFKGLENQNIAPRIEQALALAAKSGGGAIELPAGTFLLSRPLIIRGDGIVLRGAGRDRTKLIFTDRIAYGDIRFFNWAGAGSRVGTATTIEFQANPKELVALQVSCAGAVIAEKKRGAKSWGNLFAIRVEPPALQTLGLGARTLDVAITYASGETFSKSFAIELTEEPMRGNHSDQHAILSIVGDGREGAEMPLREDGRRGSRRIHLSAGHGLKTGEMIQIEAPVTPRWNRLVGNISNGNRFRINQYEVTAVDGDWVTLNQPLRMVFPVIDGSFAQRIRYTRGSGIENLTVEQQVITTQPGPRIKELGWYPMEDLWTDGITTSYAYGCWVRGVRIVHPGRNAIYLVRSKFCEVRDAECFGALFKGGGGTGYAGLERSFDCLMESLVTRELRHAPDLQYGSAGNVIRNGRFYGSDGQWHAGWTNENLFENNLIVSGSTDMENGGYGFGLFASGPSSPLHGPQGPRNVVYNNDIVSPKDGLHMMGGNEAWIILHNRFRITEGRAIYGKEKSFDHTIRGNVFIIEKPTGAAVLFEAPDCVGIDLSGNTIYGPVRQLAEFKGGADQRARIADNRILPYDTEAPRPAPPVASIFDWQRAQKPRAALVSKTGQPENPSTLQP